MCDSLKTIAKITPNRLLGHCSCGCLHLVWDHATIRFHDTELRHVLSQFLSQRELAPDHHPPQEVHVWLQHAGLKMSPHSFKQFVTLLEQGLDTLHRTPNHTHPQPHPCASTLEHIN